MAFLGSPPRFHAPFRPHRRGELSFFDRLVARVERLVKGPVFGCRMCGNCVLQTTAYVCPMTCPKGLRNGPCGGSTPDACEVDPSRPCTWHQIYQRSERMGHSDRLLEVRSPLDGRAVGRETWLRLFRTWRQRGQGPRVRDRILDPKRFRRESEALFFEVRQPEWWQGDALPHPAPYQEPLSRLETHLRSDAFVTTAEIAPPLDVSRDKILEKVNAAKRYVSAANFTDNASASARMSSVAASAICLESGLEPIMQLQARDRSRVVIASDAIGAAGLGIRNVLCLSGDHQSSGPGPVARAEQFDMDALQVLWMLRRMRDEGVYLDGRKIARRPQLFLGAAASPYATIPRYEALRLEAKINAGAQFIQTQPVFDYPRFLEWLEALDKRHLLDRVPILVGLVPLKSARAANFMANEVSGVHIPQAVTKRMEAAGDAENQRETGVQIALETIEKLKGTPGIRGIHLMPIHWESLIPRLVEEGGLPLPAE